MAFFSGGGLGNSSKQQTTNTTFNSDEVNQQIRDGIGLSVSGSDNAISITDGGAIEALRDVTKSVVEQSKNSIAQSLTFAQRAGESALAAANPDQTTVQKLGVYAAIVAVAVLAVPLVMRGFK